MHKAKKLLSTLVLGLMITGCDVEALPSDYEETYGAINMEEVYDSIRNGQGEAAIYNQLINIIAEKEVIVENNRSKELNSRLQEKIDDMIEDQYTDINYAAYTKTADKSTYTTINYDKLNAYYKSQGYKLSETANVDLWNVEKVLAKDSTIVNTYISKTLKNEVLSSMLNEQFIYEKKANSLYKTKQLRQVEYVYLDLNSDNYDTEFAFIKKVNDELMNGTRTDLVSIETEWKAIKKDFIDTNAQKAGDPELDEDGEYYTEFTSCSNSNVKECANEKMYAIDDTEYYSEPKIYTKNDSPLLAAMTDVLFSSTLKTSDDEVFEKNGSYYLKSQSDLELGVDCLYNVDTSTSKYYFVRFQIVENEHPENYEYTNITPEFEGQEVKYAIAQALATESSNYSNCIIYYLNKYSVAINDDKFFEYVFDTYGYPEED